MAEFESSNCPECHEAFDYPAPPPVSRRGFLRTAAAGAAAVAAASPLLADTAKPAEKKPRPAEELVKELFSTLKDDQRKLVVAAYDAGSPKGAKGGIPKRLRMENQAMDKVYIEKVYTKPQIELVERIVKAMSSSDDGFKQISRGGTWDGSHSFGKCGAHVYGDPTGKEPWAFTFTGHHLTIRCDGNFHDGIAFGGPIYYGHTPNGYSPANLFNYQTKIALGVLDALDGKQRDKAIVKGNPGEGAGSVRFRKNAADRPGILGSDLSKDQLELVEKTMRGVLSPFRAEDGDEVMNAIKASGGLQKIHLAFYTEPEKEGAEKKKDQWTFWRLEGPGFVWNFRVLPHVHTFVNISSKLA